jgi:hypothetical protein
MYSTCIARTPMIPPEADMEPMALGNRVAAMTAKVDTRSIGLIENIVPTVCDTAQNRRPTAIAMDMVARLISENIFFVSDC